DRPPRDAQGSRRAATADRSAGAARHPRSPCRRRHDPRGLRVDLAGRTCGSDRRVPDRSALRAAAGTLARSDPPGGHVTGRPEPTGTRPATLRNHWYWRPGWRPGRHFYTWHLTFDHADELHHLVDAYQRRLAGLPELDLIPRPWLHLTMQGLGFLDQVTAQNAHRIAHAPAALLAGLPAPDLTFPQLAVPAQALTPPQAPSSP